MTPPPTWQDIRRAQLRGYEAIESMNLDASRKATVEERLAVLSSIYELFRLHQMNIPLRDAETEDARLVWVRYRRKYAPADPA